MLNEYNRLGSVIKSARKANRMTQKELSEKLQICTRHLKAIENNGQKPSFRLLEQLIKELNIPANMVFNIDYVGNKK